MSRRQPLPDRDLWSELAGSIEAVQTAITCLLDTSTAEPEAERLLASLARTTALQRQLVAILRRRAILANTIQSGS